MSPKRVFSLCRIPLAFIVQIKMNKKHNTHNMKGLSIYIKKIPIFYLFISYLIRRYLTRAIYYISSAERLQISSSSSYAFT